MSIVRYIIAVMLVLGGFALLRADYTTQAGTKTVFGRFDGAEADSSGEVSYKLYGIVTGMPPESLRAQDTVMVDTVYSLSALDSVLVTDSLGAANHDTVDYRFWVQNQGNLISDSIVVTAVLVDTSNAGHFVPGYFRILDKSRTAQGGIKSVDSVWYGVRLAEGAIDTFYVRTTIPGLVQAQDGESLAIQVLVKDRSGAGINDSWPAGQAVIDTSGVALNTHGDTLWDYGDTQTKNVLIKVRSATLHIQSLMNKVNTVPGDTLMCAMNYNNSGSASTKDTVSILQLLPKYVRYADNTATGAYHAGESNTQIKFSSLATRTVFDKDSSWANSHVDSVAGVKWTFGQSINAADGGSVRFRVIVK
jgi:hypothetical protein